MIGFCFPGVLVWWRSLLSPLVVVCIAKCLCWCIDSVGTALFSLLFDLVAALINGAVSLFCFLSVVGKLWQIWIHFSVIWTAQNILRWLTFLKVILCCSLKRPHVLI